MTEEELAIQWAIHVVNKKFKNPFPKGSNPKLWKNEQQRRVESLANTIIDPFTWLLENFEITPKRKTI